MSDVARVRLRDLLGAEPWIALRRLLKSERRSMRDLLLPAESLARNRAEENRARVERANAFLHTIGVILDHLRPIGCEYAAGLEGLIPLAGEVGPGFSLEHH